MSAPIVIADPGNEPLPPLSDNTIALIHSGLEIPNERAIKSMAREIRKWRGNPDPDLV